jgi:hypothetical protein
MSVKSSTFGHPRSLSISCGNEVARARKVCRTPYNCKQELKNNKKMFHHDELLVPKRKSAKITTCKALSFARENMCK